MQADNNAGDCPSCECIQPYSFDHETPVLQNIQGHRVNRVTPVFVAAIAKVRQSLTLTLYRSGPSLWRADIVTPDR